MSTKAELGSPPMPSDEIIETMAEGMLHYDMPHVNAWNIVEEGHRADYRHRARAALSAAEAAGWVMVRKEKSDE